MNEVPIHQSLTRPNMIMGCDRELYLSMIIVCALFLGPGGIMKGSVPAVVMGVLMWLVGQRALAVMGKKDARSGTPIFAALNTKVTTQQPRASTPTKN